MIDNFPIHTIIRTTADYYGLTQNDLVSMRRNSELVMARQIAMWLCTRLTIASYPEIGRAFRRDHTTILHGVKKIQGLVDDGFIRFDYLIELAKSNLKQALPKHESIYSLAILDYEQRLHSLIREQLRNDPIGTIKRVMAALEGDKADAA